MAILVMIGATVNGRPLAAVQIMCR